MPSNDENLGQIQQELHAALEDSITELLGHVRAAKTIASRISAADKELAKYAELREALEGEGTSTKREALEANVARIQSMRDDLTETLASLTGELRNLSSGDAAS